MQIIQPDNHSEIKEKMVRCIQNVVEDGIRIDIEASGLKTRNSEPTRIWDLLNTELVNTLGKDDCVPLIVVRGPWQMVVIYDRISKLIYTFMREARFTELQKKRLKRTHMHYLDIFAKALNRELHRDPDQMSLFDNDSHVFDDEDQLDNKVETILSDLEGGSSVVRHHVLVLFEASHYHLSHVRAVMITPNLEIAEGQEEDWSQYISVSESCIVDQVDNPEAAHNTPTRGLKLKPKALERQKQRPPRKKSAQEKRDVT